MTQDINPNTSNLCHPPFTFNLNSFEPGILRAESFKEGVLWASHSIGTSGKAAKVKVEPDFTGRRLKADGGDIIFILAFITDMEGNIDINYSLPVLFEANGNSFLIGENTVSAEAGIATIMLKEGTASGKINVKASSSDLLSSEIEIFSEK